MAGDACRSRGDVERLIAQNKKLVLVTARRFFPRLCWDEDLLQCGMIGLWEAARDWSGQGEFSTYASRCILNNMRDYVRQASKEPPPMMRRRRLERSLDCEDNIICRLDTESRIKRAWPENSRERYVLLALMAGMSRQSIAAALGVQLHTLRRIIARAMEGLAREGED